MCCLNDMENLFHFVFLLSVLLGIAPKIKTETDLVKMHLNHLNKEVPWINPAKNEECCSSAALVLLFSFFACTHNCNMIMFKQGILLVMSLHLMLFYVSFSTICMLWLLDMQERKSGELHFLGTKNLNTETHYLLSFMFCCPQTFLELHNKTVCAAFC